jgi:lysophospholipid acyltransferase (LPLAT)-like uncharacterized protein
VSLAKSIFQSETLRRILCWIAALYIRLVRHTGPWSLIKDDALAPFGSFGKPFILCFWHGRILMMPYVWQREDAIHMLISQHRDGQLIAKTVGHFSIETIAGSTSSGGTSALRAMLKTLKEGRCVGVTPDGPRGPRMRASMGIVNLARISGVPIIPATFGVTRRKVLSSWDHFIVPFPFSRGVFVWGDPIVVARSADDEALEAARKNVEDSLNAISEKADRICNLEPIEPAP